MNCKKTIDYLSSMKKEWIFKFSLFIFLLVINLILLFLDLPNLNAILTIGVIITSITLFSLARKFEFYSLDLYLSYVFNVIAIIFNFYALYSI